MNIWTDICVNLTNQRFASDQEAVIERAINNGVQRMLIVGTDITSSHAAIELCHRYPDHMRATVGCHPHDAKTMDEKAWQQLEDLLASPMVVAVGECGLDFNRNFSEPATQLEVFARQMALASDKDLPVFLHERDACIEMLSILSQYPKPKKVIHCFTGSEEQAQGYLELDCYIGVTGWVTDERRNQDLVSAIEIIPNERLLIETDAPYLLPKNITPKPKSGRCEPCHLPYVSEKIAELRNTNHDVLVAVTTLNSIKLFNWPVAESLL